MEDQEREEAEAEGPNATVVAKLVTSHVLVPRTRLEEEVEATVGDSLRKLGMFHHVSLFFLSITLISYTCGGVGHMSRDCVQGSKCYNCNGFVSISLLSNTSAS